VFLAGAALMGYAVMTLSGMPYLLVFVLLWLMMVEYAVVRAWWCDACEVYETWRGRS
jgi:hypothetical protein